MTTISTLEYIFWPWGVIKKTRQELSKLQNQNRNLLRERQYYIRRGEAADATNTLPSKLFARIEEMRQQLLDSENDNGKLQQEVKILRERIKQLEA